MRYLSTNNDGTVAIWSCVPKTITDTATGESMTVFGVRIRNGKVVFYGLWTNKSREDQIIAGDEGFDIGDLGVNSLRGFTIEFPDFNADIKAKLHETDRDRIVSHRKLKREEVVLDRTFRGAWRDGATKIDVDMPSAREITRDRLRRDRKPLLADLDVESIKAIEVKDDVRLAEIAVEKQRLRDITADPRIDAALTPDELKAISV
jgi:hypothetical protein